MMFINIAQNSETHTQKHPLPNPLLQVAKAAKSDVSGEKLMLRRRRPNRHVIPVKTGIHVRKPCELLKTEPSHACSDRFGAFAPNNGKLLLATSLLLHPFDGDFDTPVGL
jgi:hypothetical protein